VAVIEIEGLKKEYRRLRRGRTVALSGLDLAVPQGGVFGFLGPNGAGKTTTIRCLLGLVRPSGGTARLLGATTRSELAGVIQRVGSIVETPAFFPAYSARRNLRLLGRLHRIGRKSIDDVLDRVGLGERARDPVRTYSLGMKQRLGIAAALLKDPELLLLDEPANGLDPAGIKEVRELLRQLATEGRTVFLSSHLLNEVEQVCDQVAILSKGRAVAVGPVHDVLARGRPASLLVRLPELDRGMAVLRAAGIASSRTEDHLVVDIPPEHASSVTRALAGAGLYLSELRAQEISLEEVFLELTKSTEEPA
jgi:ABC-2 type transport system ATP-binding protein